MLLILLVGPKGVGKSHIGRLLERELGIAFFEVEAAWLEFRRRCEHERRPFSQDAGIEYVHAQVAAALREKQRLSVETTGASAPILASLRSLAPREHTLIVRVDAPAALCRTRIDERDARRHLPVDEETIRRADEASRALQIDADLHLVNVDLDDRDIVARIASMLRDTGRKS